MPVAGGTPELVDTTAGPPVSGYLTWGEQNRDFIFLRDPMGLLNRIPKNGSSEPWYSGNGYDAKVVAGPYMFWYSLAALGMAEGRNGTVSADGHYMPLNYDIANVDGGGPSRAIATSGMRIVFSTADGLYSVTAP